MSYLAQEEAVETGKPIELYRFSNLEDTFNYTSAQDAITVDSITYEPRNLSRNEADVRSDQEPGNLVLRLPADDVLVTRYRASVPASRDKLIVRRMHLSDTPTPEVVVFWRGEIASVAFEGDEAIVACEPSGAVVRRPIPRRSYSVVCGHVLYDRGCKVNENNPLFKFDVTVTAITGSTISVSGTNVGSQASDFFVAGFLDRGTVERRMVLSQQNDSPTQVTLGLLLPFADLSVGSELTLRAGCNHTAATCHNKFNNIVNHGGFPWVPTENPFSTGIT